LQISIKTLSISGWKKLKDNKRNLTYKKKKKKEKKETDFYDEKLNSWHCGGKIERKKIGWEETDRQTDRHTHRTEKKRRGEETDARVLFSVIETRVEAEKSREVEVFDAIFE